MKELDNRLFLIQALEDTEVKETSLADWMLVRQRNNADRKRAESQRAEK